MRARIDLIYRVEKDKLRDTAYGRDNLLLLAIRVRNVKTLQR